MNGLRDSALMPAEQYLEFYGEKWLRLPINGDRLVEGLSLDALDRFAEDPSTGVLFPSLTGANKEPDLSVCGVCSATSREAAAGQIKADSVKLHGDISRN